MSDTLDKFYAYRTLLGDESWAAILVSSEISKLPNIDFGMLVFAENEKSAIARARGVYEKIHKSDNDKSNIREFIKGVLPSLIEKYDRGGDIDKGVARDISKSSVFIASYINDEFNRNWNAKDDDGQ